MEGKNLTVNVMQVTDNGKFTYTRGLHELGDGLYAWLQPDGSWG